MSHVKRQIWCMQVTHSVLLVLVLGTGFLFPLQGLCETYGVKDPGGNFTPKLNVVVDKKEVMIKKIDAQEKFRFLSLKLNPANRNLLKNVAHLQVEWIGPGNRASRPVPFAGPTYDRTTNIFQEAMIRSVAVKIVDKSPHNLFAGKKLADLFSIRIDQQPVVSVESVNEKDRTVQLGAGRDVSINVDKPTVVFNESNLKRGEIVNVDNRGTKEQVLWVDIPLKGFVFVQIMRKPEQKKIPKEDWNRFVVPADQGVFIVLIPEPDPALLAQLEGKEVIIRVYQGSDAREVQRIPIEISSDLRLHKPTGVSTVSEPPRHEERAVPLRTNTANQKPVRTEANARRQEIRYGLWLWIVQVANLILLVFLAVYTVFFLLPKIQVLEDRVAKSEMFLHGSREAIREELDQIKRDVIKQYQKDETREP